jgi:hypothetical protein
MKTPTYPFTPQIAVQICQRHLRIQEKSARRASLRRRLICPIRFLLRALRVSA